VEGTCGLPSPPRRAQAALRPPPSLLGVSCADKGRVPPLPPLQQPGQPAAPPPLPSSPVLSGAFPGWWAGGSGRREKRLPAPGAPRSGESRGSLTGSGVLISRAAPHRRSESGTVSTLLILHRPRGIIFFSREGVIIILCPKGLKISACRKQAAVGGFIPGSPGWGEQVSCTRPVPAARSRGAEGCWLPVPVRSPHDISPSGSEGGRLPAGPRSGARLLLLFPRVGLRLQSGSCGQR